MATGRVLQFDQTRGYGFVAAEDGGEDIFLHTSVFDGDPSELVPGMRVEFKVMAGDRGRKAFAAHLAADESHDGPAVAAQRPEVNPGREAYPVSGSSAPVTQPPGEDQMCDVLSQVEFGQELVELLLTAAPTLTGAQILQVRESTLEIAKKHGWVDI